MTKISDEKWKEVMDQTQGHKVARALYEAMQKFTDTGTGGSFQLVPHLSAPEGNPYPTTSSFYNTWEQLFPYEQELFIAVAGELFDNGVIDGGHALPKLPKQPQE